MNDKTSRIIYWVSTTLMCLLFLFSAGMYFLQNDMASQAFESLGYPTYLVYPLAVVKILGVVAVLSNKSKVLKEWAYAGFFFDAVLAAFAHIKVQDGSEIAAIIGIVLILVSRYFWKKD